MSSKCPLLKPVFLVVCVFLLASCGNYQLIEDRSDHYMHSQKGSQLIVPEWYSDRRLQDRYPIPQADKSFVKTEQFEVPAPPEPSIAILQQQFVIKTLQEDTWLLASEPPGKMWPALKAYWEFFGATVNELNTSTGVMKVIFQENSLKARQYLENNDLEDAGNGVELNVLVEQGLKRRSSEIRIDTIAGQPAEQTREKQLLTHVSQFLDNRADSFESYSLAAEEISSQQKLALVNEPNSLYIKVNLTFERAWHAVGEALVRSNIPIIDWNRAEGRYFVNYQVEEDEGSWLPDILNFGKDEQVTDSFNFKIELSSSEEGIHIVSVPLSDIADEQDRIRLLNQLLDHMS